MGERTPETATPARRSRRLGVRPIDAPIAAAFRSQPAASRVEVIGVDGMDPTGAALRFVHQSGVTFPVGADPDYRVTEGLYAFVGDPDAVFVDGNGTIVRIVHGAITASQLRRWERALS